MKEQEERLHLRLRRLCDEHASAVEALINEHSRTVEEALTDCMANLAKIEEDADAEMNRALEEYRAATKPNDDEEEGEKTSASTAHWDYQKRINAITLDAREAAQAERTAYREKCKAAQTRLDELNNKARVDLLKSTQKLFQDLDVDSLDPAAIEHTAQAIWSGWSANQSN